MSRSNQLNPTDSRTVESAIYLCDQLELGLPRGETPETVGDFIDCHLKAVREIKRFDGKLKLLTRLLSLANKYPVVPYAN